jgi:hypothetical protein
MFFVFILSVVVFNGCRQRNNTVNENITKTENPIIENINTSDKDFAEIGVVDVSGLSSFREINITSPRMHGPDIRSLQERLVEIGFIGIGEIDGYYGPKTAEEIYFIKSALGFVDYFILGSDEEHYVGTDLDYRPEDYPVVNKELWDIIFDHEKTIA